MEQLIDEKYNLITRGLQEKIDDELVVKKILAVRPLKIYWGTAPTGLIHLGYFVPMLKIADFLNAGCEVTILIADLHAVLDNMKSTFEQIEARTEYYIIMIKTILESLNVDISKLKFVKGTDYQLSKEYTLDMYKAHTLISVNEAKHAGAEVVKQSTNPKMTGLLYPTLQGLDEQYLDVDAEFGGVDQRKIFGHALDVMPKLGYRKRFYYMNQMVPGLRFEKSVKSIKSEDKKISREHLMNLINSDLDDDSLVKNITEHLESIKTVESIAKMSSSSLDSKIDLLDGKNKLKSKIGKAYCCPGDVDDNCLLIMLEKIIFPVLKYKGDNFIINRKIEYGGPIIYTEFMEVKNDFASHVINQKNEPEYKLHPGDFKLGIIESLDTILQPIRTVFQTKEMQQLLKKAY